MSVHARTLEELYDERIGVVHTVGGELTDLIHVGVANHLVLEGYGEHLVIAQRLVEAYEAQLAVEGIFVAVQQARTLYLLVVLSTGHAEALHVARHRIDAAHSGRVYQLQQVVAVVAGHHWSYATHARIRRAVLAEVRQGQYVSVLRHRGTHIGTPHLDA